MRLSRYVHTRKKNKSLMSKHGTSFKTIVHASARLRTAEGVWKRWCVRMFECWGMCLENSDWNWRPQGCTEARLARPEWVATIVQNAQENSEGSRAAKKLAWPSPRSSGQRNGKGTITTKQDKDVQAWWPRTTGRTAPRERCKDTKTGQNNIVQAVPMMCPFNKAVAWYEKRPRLYHASCATLLKQ